MTRLALAILALLCLTQPARAQAVMRPAADAIFQAFATHPLVGLGDDHGLSRAMDFYAQLVSDPRFVSVGNVVVEFGAGGRQDVIDRYVAGERVTYAELRTVWTDTVGWLPTAGYLGFAKFFAAVRAVNRKLPADKRIRVWLGEPPMDWSAPTPDTLMAAMNARDSRPAEIIATQIMGKGRRALVIYGALHFGAGNWLGGRVYAAHPGAMFVALPFLGARQQPNCLPLQEQAWKLWPDPAMLASNCAGQGDAVIFYSPPLNHYRDPWLPDYLLDPEYRREMARRAALGGPRLIRWPQGFVLERRDYDVDLDAPGFREAIDAMFAKHDRNRDGRVTQDEYIDPIP